MTSCNTLNCRIPIQKYMLLNNKWGAPDTDQSIYVINDNIAGIEWNNALRGFNYGEIYAGTPRFYFTNTWSVFPLQYKNFNSCLVQLKYKFTKKPTVNSWWNFAFDIYWMDGTTPTSQKMYNIMIWIHGKQEFGGSLILGDVSDGYNIYGYRRSVTSSWPFDQFILKNRDSIPYEPVLNQEYSITIDIKALMNAVSRQLNGNWYIPGIELGCENSGILGTTSGAIELSTYNLEVNGNIIGLTQFPMICSFKYNQD